jgi:hypothetical protein
MKQKHSLKRKKQLLRKKRKEKARQRKLSFNNKIQQKKVLQQKQPLSQQNKVTDQVTNISMERMTNILHHTLEKSLPINTFVDLMQFLRQNQEAIIDGRFIA